MSCYYNEHDAKTAAWLRELIKRGLIAGGEVDERSIADVRADDLRGFRRCHFFAGIGGWDYALQLAGWPGDRSVWTGSPPCQPHSSAARGRNVAPDPTPAWLTLILLCRPRWVFGEQVASARRWLDGLFDGLESGGYVCGAAILPACSVGLDHARERLYFACYTNSEGESRLSLDGEVARVPWHNSEPGSVVPTDGIPRRMALQGFGNAIVPQVAAEFVMAADEAMFS